jgi:FAD synthase
MDPVELTGKVVRFQGNGRKLGYPTANIVSPTELEDGVYFGFADLAQYKYHPAIIFIGVPTTMGDKDRRIEAYLLNIADKDYYDNELCLMVQHYHRPNETFNSVGDLVEVMREDEAIARRWFNL